MMNVKTSKQTNYLCILIGTLLGGTIMQFMKLPDSRDIISTAVVLLIVAHTWVYLLTGEENGKTTNDKAD